jgi:hypothetical protein
MTYRYLRSVKHEAHEVSCESPSQRNEKISKSNFENHWIFFNIILNNTRGRLVMNGFVQKIRSSLGT